LQLFDLDNPLHRDGEPYIFTTEGHILPLKYPFREKLANLYDKDQHNYMNTHMPGKVSVTAVIMKALHTAAILHFHFP